MQWRGRRQSGNVEDRRGQGGGFGGGLGRMGGGGIGLPGGGGGLGIGTIIIIGLVLWFLGVNPLALLGLLGGSVMQGGGQQTTSQPGQTGAPSDEAGEFVATVLADTEDTWNGIFTAAGQKYVEPTLVLFTGSTSSACGFASAASGPFYCPADQKVYIDLAFYDELSKRFNAPGEFAEAYVIAHEVGHHVQNLLGILPRVNQQRQRVSQQQSNELSIRVELQADCLAGIYAKQSEKMGVVNDQDIADALNAAAAVGDDSIQQRTQGYVVPESFNHGTSDQRMRWFKQGLQTGSVQSCDTFQVAQP